MEMVEALRDTYFTAAEQWSFAIATRLRGVELC